MQSKQTEKENRYRQLTKQLSELLNKDEPIITNLSNVSAAIYENISNISWVGFYILKTNHLFLGPFQGKIACTKIDIGKGVCGLSAKLKMTQVVPNVHVFPDHIVCDPESNSEIVVPIVSNSQIFGVLDLDSKLFGNFDSIDKEWLEKICYLLAERLNLENYIYN